MLNAVQFKERLLKLTTATRVVSLTVHWLAARGLSTPHTAGARAHAQPSTMHSLRYLCDALPKQANQPPPHLPHDPSNTHSRIVTTENKEKKTDSTPDANSPSLSLSLSLSLALPHSCEHISACHPLIRTGVTKNSFMQTQPLSH
jgi:hypothetical protein